MLENHKLKTAVDEILHHGKNILRGINWYDLKNGVNTGAFVNKECLYTSIDSPNRASMNRYEPTDLGKLAKMLTELTRIDATVLEHALIDYGCGKGRVLIEATRMGFKKAIGVEFSKQLCDTCEKNLRRLKCATAEVVCEDAVAYNLPDDIRTFYFFNPFDYSILEKVLGNIKMYLHSRAYIGYIIYVYPKIFGRLDANEFELLCEDNGSINPFHIYKVIL